MKKLLLVFFVFNCFLLTVVAQQKTITGVVTGSEDGLPVIGATVMIKGTATGVATDLDGKYSLQAAEGAVIEFRYVGMKTKEVVVGTSNVYNVTMELESIGIDEIVVVGYGTQIKSKVTGSIAKVSGESLKNIPVPSVELALQGKSAGVFIEAQNGKATGTTRMRIRGSSSITASNQPLFVVDGIPISTETVNQSGAAINPLSTLNFNDVESVEILKDAASSAIFGSRGANGVVIITTKKGKAGEAKIEFNLQSGFSQASHRREFLNTDEYISYFREAAYNSDLLDGIDPINNPDDFHNSWLEFTEQRFIRYSGWAAKMDPVNLLDPSDPSEGYAYLGSEVNTNWQDLAFQTGKLFSANLSASGGTDKLKYFLSGTYDDQQGILVGNGISKYSARLNLDNKVNKYLDLGLALSMTNNLIDQVAGDNAFSTPMQLVAMAPITPPRDENGVLYDRPTTTYYNGLIDVEDAKRTISNFRIITNTYLNFHLYKGLTWKNELGFDLYTTKENARYGERTDAGQGIGGYGFSNYGENQNLSTKSYFDYINQFGDFGFSAVLGVEFQKTVLDNTWVEGQEFPLDDLKTLASAGLISGGSSTKSEYTFLSYFTRINFDYKAKYLLTLAGRIDGSSRFGSDNRYGQFPAASLGWVISKEDFLANNSLLSFLKVRTSYGLTGNAGIGNFKHLGLYGVEKYNGIPGLIPTQIANSNLGWETTRQVDFGIDFGFFKNRISGEFDLYDKNTNDLLLDVPVPATSGYLTQTANVGAVNNKGVEFVLNTTNMTGEFEWTTSLNLSYNKNEVTDLGGQTLIDEGGSRIMNVVKLGEQLGAFYGAEYAGVDSENGDALWFVNTKDAEGNVIDHTSTTNDFASANFVVLGNPTPPVLGAITNTLSYKGFTLTFTFQGVTGNKIHLAGDSYMAANGVWFDNQTKDQLNSWRQPGDITMIPQARLYYENGDQTRSSRYLSDGDYLKLRTAILSYDLPVRIAKKVGLGGIRIYAQGQNLLTFTKYTGWDPEVSSDDFVTNVVSGLDFYSAPQPRTILFGININL
jgi:TonB-dependent starch-binding outer membrane protein SusC